MSRPIAPTPDHRALAPLKEKFSGIGLRVGQFRDMVTVVVPREHIKAVLKFLRDDPTLRYDMLFELNGVDYLNFPGIGPDQRFGINYGLLSLANNDRLWLKVFLNPTLDTSPGHALPDHEAMEKGDPGLKIDTVTDLYASADWMEREAYDLLGILFVGHPDLRRIFTWSGFKSYPLRKDYPLRGTGEREDYTIVTRDSA